VRFPVIGNDVVDLTDPAIARHHDKERFIERVCCEDERARVATARDLWSLFAAKEAAYKAVVKLGGSPGFGHRSIHVAPDLATVAWRDLRLALHIAVGDDHVHAVAWTEGGRPLARVVRVDAEASPVVDAEASPPIEAESDRARAVLRELLSTALGYPAGELEVVRDSSPGSWDGYGPPRVLLAGAKLDADVSLSHDGHFVAAAAILGAGLRRAR
jgi:phosphopantetheinyl transferase (holo-ACP synthase)